MTTTFMPLNRDTYTTTILSPAMALQKHCETPLKTGRLLLPAQLDIPLFSQSTVLVYPLPLSDTFTQIDLYFTLT